MLSELQNILWPVALLGGIGALIDFFLGKAGQRRLKGWLEVQWYKFHEVNWHNFTAKEASYYIKASDRIVGAKLFSIRRTSLTVLLTMFVVAYFCVAVRLELPSKVDDADVREYIPSIWSLATWLWWPGIVLAAIAFAISVSLSRRIALCVIAFGRNRQIGPSIFLFLLIFHYGLLVVWRPLVDVAIEIENGIIADRDIRIWRWWDFEKHWVNIPAGNGVTISEKNLTLIPPINWRPGDVLSEFNHSTDTAQAVAIFEMAMAPRGDDAKKGAVRLFVISWIDDAIGATLSYVANAARILFSAILLLSFLAREWLGRIFSTAWARLVESDGPVFTIVFSGAALLASTLEQVIAHIAR